MNTFQRGEHVKYVSPRGNIYKCTVLHCFDANFPYSTVLGGPNACSLRVDTSTIISREEYIYPVGAEMLIHKSRLVRDLVDVINSKAKNQALRNVYESKTGQDSRPGVGPLNTIRSFAGIKVPKGAEGGRRKTHKQRKNKRRNTRK